MSSIENQRSAIPRATTAAIASSSVALSPRLLGTMAVSAALVSANLYYNQPLLADMARTFHVSAEQIGWVAMLTQTGCAAGVLFIVPLGDAIDRRRLVMIMCFLALAALVGVAASPNLATISAASFALGLASIVPQLLLPYAAHLARPQERGRAVGIVLGGLLIGMLIGRTISGYVGQQFGWRVMYWIATVVMLVIAVVLRACLPRTGSRADLSYGRLLLSLWHLLAEQPVLRETALIGAMLFGGFSAFWSTLVFRLESPPYHYGSRAAGLFGLVGIVGALAPSVAGHWADQHDPRQLTRGAVALTLAAFALFWIFGHQLWGLIVGIVMLDLGVNGGSICCHTRNYRLLPNATNRLATIYITAFFIGGSIGTNLATYGWQHFGYSGVCAAGAALLAIAAIPLLMPAPKPRPAR